MGYPTDRVLVYNRDATFAFEITPDEQRSRKRVEQINDEHSLTIVTTRRLSEGMRLLTVDDIGKWREWVVYKADEDHSSGKCAIGTYLCMWSLQYDLTGTYAEEHAEPGMGSSCTSRAAIVAALDGQSLWSVGTCDAPSVDAGKGCVMIGVSAWERLSLAVEHWHGEIDAQITMDDTRVTARKVDFRAHLGSTTVTRRFDWSEDMTSIKRSADVGPYFCRVVPLGRGQREYAEDDETEFDWPLDISEETGGRVYIEDAESAQVFRTKLPDGTWHYPTKVVHYDEDDPELLLNAGNEDLHNHTRPGVSYEANVLQFVRAGMDAKGVQLGDSTQCADFGFNPDAALTVEGRITRLEVEELSPESDTKATIGDIAPTFAQTLRQLVASQTTGITNRVNHIEGAGTIVYLENLLDELNSEINATGGYTYFVDGEGSITYDRRVSNPLVGAEATQVVQIKGGSIRIANEKKPSFSGINDWVWKSVFTSGHVAAELVTAAQIVAGYIGSSGDTYIDLDNHTVQLGQTSGPHVVVNANGYEVFDKDGNSVLFCGIESGKSIVRCGRASGAGNVVMSGDGYVRIRNGSDIIAHFGTAEYTLDSQVIKGPYYNLGTRDGNPGANTIVGGVDNFAGTQCRYASAFGLGLIAPGGSTGGIAIGKYNVATGSGSNRKAGASLGTSDPIFVIGNGSNASNRANILEVDGVGRLSLASGLNAPNVGAVLETSASGSPGSGTSYNSVGSIQLPRNGVWMIFVNLTFGGIVTSSGSSEARVKVEAGTMTICKASTNKDQVSASGVYEASGSSSYYTVYLYAGYTSTTGSATCSGTMKAVQIR